MCEDWIFWLFGHWQYEGNYKVLESNFRFLLKKSALFWLVDGKYEKIGIWDVKVFHYEFVLTPEREITSTSFGLVWLLLESWNSKVRHFLYRERKTYSLCENIIFVWVNRVSRDECCYLGSASWKINSHTEVSSILHMEFVREVLLVATRVVDLRTMNLDTWVELYFYKMETQCFWR